MAVATDSMKSVVIENNTVQQIAEERNFDNSLVYLSRLTVSIFRQKDVEL